MVVAGRMPAITIDACRHEAANRVPPNACGHAKWVFSPTARRPSLRNGQTLSGHDCQRKLHGCADANADDKQIHLLRRRDCGGKFREVTSEVNWPSYNGDPGGNRYTTLTQIDKSNVKRVAPHWIFTLPDVFPLEGTPGGDGWRHVCDKRQRMLRAGRRQRTPDLALSSRPDEAA